MANKKSNTNKMPIIIGACVAVVAVVAIVVGIIFAVRNSGNALGDGYFVSDGSKYVLTLENDEDDLNEDETDTPAPAKTHMVYYYSGDEITGFKQFYEFADSATAQKAYETYKEIEDDTYESIELNGKYIVITGTPSSYEGLTTTDVKQQIEFIKSLENLGTDDNGFVEDAETVEEGEVVEDTTEPAESTEESTENQ